MRNNTEAMQHKGNCMKSKKQLLIIDFMCNKFFYFLQKWMYMNKVVFFLSFFLIIPFCSAQEKVVYNVYFAGDLFDQKHLTGNFLLAQNIEKLSDGKYKCNLPQDWEGKENSAVEIRNRDIESIMKSDLAIFNFDGMDLDSGTVVEFMVAKALDIPCVLLRTDFRNGGYLFGDDWNLMVSNYPRSGIVKHLAITIYNSFGLTETHNLISKSIIETFEKVMKENSLFNSRDKIVSAYQHVVKMCGGGLDKIIDDKVIYKIVDSKIKKHVYDRRDLVKNNIKYKNIIFDFGGVLVNFNLKEILQDLFKNEKIMPIEQWYEFFRCDAFEKLEKGTIHALQALKEIPEKYNKDQIVKLFTNMSNYLYPLDKAINLLHLIKSKNYKIYLLSNTADGSFDRNAPEYDFLKLFDGIMLSHEVNAVKPYPEIYKILLNTYSLNPEECLFIDDFEVNVVGAKKVGIDGIVCKDHDLMISELGSLGILNQEEVNGLCATLQFSKHVNNQSEQKL